MFVSRRGSLFSPVSLRGQRAAGAGAAAGADNMVQPLGLRDNSSRCGDYWGGNRNSSAFFADTGVAQPQQKKKGNHGEHRGHREDLFVVRILRVLDVLCGSPNAFCYKTLTQPPLEDFAKDLTIFEVSSTACGCGSWPVCQRTLIPGSGGPARARGHRGWVPPGGIGIYTSV